VISEFFNVTVVLLVMFFLGFSEALPAILLLSPGVSFVNTYVVQRVLQRNDQAA